MNEHELPDPTSQPENESGTPENEAPQVFALQKDGATWSVSRRAFLSTSALAGAASLPGCGGCNPKKPGAGGGPGTMAHIGTVTHLSITPQGDKLITGGSDNQIKVWDLPGGTLARTLTGHNSPLSGLALSGDGQRLASSDMSGVVKFWSTNGTTMLGTLNKGTVGPAAIFLSHDGSQLFQLLQGKIVVMNLQWGAAQVSVLSESTVEVPNLARHIFIRHGQSVYSCAIHTDQTVRLRALPAGTDMGGFRRDSSSVTALAASPEGTSLALLASGGNVEVWSLTDGTLKAAGKIASGTKIRFLNESTLVVLSGKTLTQYTIRPPHLEQSGSVELKDDEEPPDGTPAMPDNMNPNFDFEVNNSHKVVIRPKGGRVIASALGDGKQQVAFRDPLAKAPTPPTSSGSSGGSGSGGSGGGGGGSYRGGGHYWRPN